MATSRKYVTMEVSITLEQQFGEKRVLSLEGKPSLRYEADEVSIRATVHDNGVVGANAITVSGYAVVGKNGSLGQVRRRETYFALEDVPAYLHPIIESHAPEVWHGHMSGKPVDITQPLPGRFPAWLLR